MTDWYSFGSFVQTWIEYDEDDGTEIPHTQDVTSRVQAVGRKATDLSLKVAALQKDLSDLKNRRYWEDIELFTDKNTGMVTTIRTTYRWQAETMRLDFTPEMMNKEKHGNI